MVQTLKTVGLLTWISLSISFSVQADFLSCQEREGNRPQPNVPAGQSNAQIPVENIIVIMQENHSFDQYFGALNGGSFYGSQVDGIKPGMSNPDALGNPVPLFHQTRLCLADTLHMWNHMHSSWNQGKMDGFFKTNGLKAMSYFTENELPYYYELANKFAIADRFFASVMSQTHPNRFYLLTGTSFGRTRNGFPLSPNQFSQKTIFELLDDYKISWKYYTDDGGYLKFFRPLYKKARSKIVPVWEYEFDLKQGTLPQVVFVESLENEEDEHPSANIQLGQAWVAHKINALMKSDYWKKSVLFLTYDEGGAFYDHVPPPEACEPDQTPPKLWPTDVKGNFKRLGFRVPFVAVSPYVKRHHVSHTVYEHTSILKFIETKFNLPALTRRDANADAMLGLFDFKNPDFTVPALPAAEVVNGGRCN